MPEKYDLTQDIHQRVFVEQLIYNSKKNHELKRTLIYEGAGGVNEGLDAIRATISTPKDLLQKARDRNLRYIVTTLYSDKEKRTLLIRTFGTSLTISGGVDLSQYSGENGTVSINLDAIGSSLEELIQKGRRRQNPAQPEQEGR